MKNQRAFNELKPHEQEALKSNLTHCPARTLNPRKKATPMLIKAHQRAVREGMQDCACKGQEC